MLSDVLKRVYNVPHIFSCRSGGLRTGRIDAPHNVKSTMALGFCKCLPSWSSMPSCCAMPGQANLSLLDGYLLLYMTVQFVKI